MSRRRRAKGRPIDGWLALCKEPGRSSFQAVSAARAITGAAKAGHGGTLDPFSEGVLPVAFGSATKTLSMVLEGDKRYRCWVRFGVETDSGDLTGEVISQGGEPPEREMLEALLPKFVGEIEQIPPAHSAIRVDGERAYKRVRRGEVVEMPSRQVTIHSLDLVEMADGLAVIDVACGKGSYMRALARDMGTALGCGAHLERLSRTETLGFQLDQTVTLEALRRAVEEDRLAEVLLPVDYLLSDWPAFTMSPDTWLDVQNGRAVWIRMEEAKQGRVRLLTPEGAFAAIGELGGSKMDLLGRVQCRPKRLFITA
ncbi:MAG: tRNA pseudouridine(55) synthase TruB [Magnetococcales bacterium]|nr:tRNA pseudouridine(55) synthase TruB [Magnetococcales bacterium]